MNVGFIGGGSIATMHAERIETLGETVAAVADIAPDVRASFVEAYDVPHAYDDYEEMIDDVDLDVVAVTVPNALHADCAIAALEADCDVFLEKPVAHTLADAERIADAAETSDGEIVVGFMMTFDSSVEALLDATSDGEFGDVYEVSVEYVRRRGIPQLGGWFTRKAVAGGGAVIDIGPHVLHLALSVLDFPEIERVSAATGTHFGDKDDYTYLSMWAGEPREDATFDVEDYARALAYTADGAVIHLDCTWASNRDPAQGIEISGTESGARLQPGGGPLRLLGTKGDGLSDTTVETREIDRYLAEWEYVFDVFRGEIAHEQNTLEEGLAVQRLIDAIYRSAEEGTDVAMDG